MSEQSHLTGEIPAHVQQELQVYRVVMSDGYTVSDGGLAEMPEINNPFDVDLSRFIPNPPVSLEGFVDLLGRVIADAQRRVVSAERVQLVQEYNPEHFPTIGDEVITFKVLSRKPANMSRDGRSRPNRGFNSAYEYLNPHEPNKIICVESRPIDHELEISAWAKTSTLANRRALWLERLLISSRWTFTSHGVTPFYWRERGADTLWTPSGTRLHQRPIKFFARMREYNILAYPTIKEFEIDFNTEV